MPSPARRNWRNWLTPGRPSAWLPSGTAWRASWPWKNSKATRLPLTKSATKKSTVAKNAPKAKKSRKGRDAGGPREGSKTETILGLLRRAKGATPAEIMEATSWQRHSVRGFISGTLGKKMGLAVKSEKREDGARVYSIAK
jgi:hypothetical protein